jgi:antitoxin CptB
MTTNHNENNLKKLGWACRRGMLELDVILEKFLYEAYAGLAPNDQLLFVRLLECPDPSLFAWLMGRAEPEDPELAKIVRLIICHARAHIKS